MRAQHLGVVRHLRHPLRRDEGRRLDRRQAGVGQALDQLDLDRGRDLARLVLQAVARADLDDAYDIGRQSVIAGIRVTASSLEVEQLGAFADLLAGARSGSPSPRRPRGAAIVCSIFIASRISSGVALRRPLRPAATSTCDDLAGHRRGEAAAACLAGVDSRMLDADGRRRTAKTCDRRPSPHDTRADALVGQSRAAMRRRAARRQRVLGSPAARAAGRRRRMRHATACVVSPSRNTKIVVRLAVQPPAVDAVPGRVRDRPTRGRARARHCFARAAARPAPRRRASSSAGRASAGNSSARLRSIRPVSRSARAKARLAATRREEGDVGRDADDLVVAPAPRAGAPSAAARGPRPRRSAWRSSGRSSGVIASPCSHAGVDAHVPVALGRAARRCTQRARSPAGNPLPGPRRRCAPRSHGREIASLLLRQRQRLARGHAQLPLDQIEAGDHLGHRVLDLQARVHFHEVEACRPARR